MRKFLNRLAANAMCGAFAAKEKVCQAVEDLKRDERGLSGIVVAVLAVVMLWGLLKDYITDIWEKITGQSSGLN